MRYLKLIFFVVLLNVVTASYAQETKKRFAFSMAIGPTNTLDNAAISVFQDATNRYNTVTYDIFAGVNIKRTSDQCVYLGLNHSSMPCYTSRVDLGELYSSNYLGLHLRHESPVTDRFTLLVGVGVGMLWAHNYYTYLEKEYDVKRTGMAIPLELGLSYAIEKNCRIGVKGGLTGANLSDADVIEMESPLDFVSRNKIFTTHLSLFVQVYL